MVGLQNLWETVDQCSKVESERKSQGGSTLFRAKTIQQGFTVTELVVTAFIFSIFVALAFGAMIPGIKVSQQAQNSIAAQREVVLAFDRLIAELGLMDRASVTVSPATLSFLSDKPYEGSNTVLNPTALKPLNLSSPYTNWQKFVVLRHRNDELIRREWPYGQGSALNQILPLQLPLLADQLGVQEKIFARGIEDFEVVPIGAASLSIRLRSVQRDSVKPEACELNLVIKMRGGV